MDQHSKYKGPREEKNKKGYENLSEEIIVENFPNVGKEITKSRKRRVPGKINPRKNTPRHIVVILTKMKDKDKILKAKRGK